MLPCFFVCRQSQNASELCSYMVNEVGRFFFFGGGFPMKSQLPVQQIRFVRKCDLLTVIDVCGHFLETMLFDLYK